MALFTTIHLYNVPAERQGPYNQWFESDHQLELAKLRGFQGAERFEVADIQIMPDILQPWQFFDSLRF